jgi:citronellol/citronellal dehydrogenase
MPMCILGMAAEFKGDGIAVNALWPRATIATAALQIIPGAQSEAGRKPEIMADAAHRVLTTDSRARTGRFLIDEDVLREAGVTDFTGYAVHPGEALRVDLFLDERP